MTHRNYLRAWLLGATVLAGGLTTAPAAFAADGAAPTADSGAPAQVSEVIVTATRRSTNIQTTPIAISAVSGAKLESLGAQDLFSAAPYLPGVSINGTAGYGNFPVGIRGIASSTSLIGSDDPVAVYIDGVYVGKPSAVMEELLDIDDVEVVRGPQGTLYGRNASAGAILLTHKAPTSTPSFVGDASYGSFGRWMVDATASGPLADGLGGSLSLRHTDEDGWGENTYNNTKAVKREATAAYGSLAFESGAVKTVLRADYEDETVEDAFKKINAVPFNTANPVTADFSLASHPDTYDFNYPTTYRHTDGGLSLNSDIDLGNGAFVRSITGYRYDKLDGSIDTDGTAANTNTNSTNEVLNQFSETLYASAKGDWGSWIAGVDLYKGLTDLNQVVGAPAIHSSLDVIASDDTSSGALFGEFTRNFGELSLTVGARVGTESKNFEYRGVATGLFPNYADTVLQKTWNDVTPSVRLAYTPSKNVMTYVSVSTGYKSGGFTALQPAAFNPEKVTTYEAGAKTTWLDGKLVLDGDVYWSDYKNLQVRVPVSVGVIETLNAAAATIKGAELEGRWYPTEHLSFTGFVNYTDARYDDYIGPGNHQNSGQYLNRAPKWDNGATARYEQPVPTGQVSGELTYAYRSEIFFQAPNITALSSPSYGQLDGRIAYDNADGHWTLALLGKNLTGERHIDNVIVFATNLVASYNEPTSYEVKLTYRY